MTKTDFAELKERLTKLDDVAANAYLTRYMEGGYVEPTYQEYGEYVHTKSSAIITQLLEIIQIQSEALEKIQEYDSVPTYVRVQYKAVLTTDFVNKTLSETTTRLQKLREGK